MKCQSCGRERAEEGYDPYVAIRYCIRHIVFCASCYTKYEQGHLVEMIDGEWLDTGGLHD